MKRFKLLLVFFLVTAWTLPGYGHDLWTMAGQENNAVLRGQIPDDLHAYDTDCITRVLAFARDGSPLAVVREDRTDRVVFQTPEPPAVTSVRADWGHRVIDDQGKKHFVSRQQAVEKEIQVKHAFFSIQFSKTLFQFSDAATRPTGMTFEAVPLKDPALLSTGSELPVRFFFEGAPLCGVPLQYPKTQEPIITDNTGTARIPIQADSGWYKILMVHDVPDPENPDIDFFRYFAFLVFKR
jgi:nickel transport protein